jgi:hypothetical protein
MALEDDEPVLAPQRSFVVVRPYPAQIRKRVFAFLEENGFEPGAEIAVGTPDAEAAAALDHSDHDLVLLPYHKHKDSEGAWVNGLGVARELGEAVIARRVPILMPVDEFTFASSFQRELRELNEANPAIAALLVVMREGEIGSAEISAQLRAAA